MLDKTQTVVIWAGISLALIGLGTSEPGSTLGLQEIFVGRCWDYYATKHEGNLPRVSTPCFVIWNYFYSAFSYKTPCAVTTKDYSTFLNYTKQELPENKSLFWSGVFARAHEYSNKGKRLITLEDTLTGYLGNALTWCGQETPPGVNYTGCPGWHDDVCASESMNSFWGAASTMFASLANGNVTVMLDGSNPDRAAYRRESYFAIHELPNLNKDKVQAVNVLLLHELDKTIIETCDTASLVLLKQDVESHGLEFQCEDNPETVLFMLCIDDPDNALCDLAIRHNNGGLRGIGRKKRSNVNTHPGSF